MKLFKKGISAVISSLFLITITIIVGITTFNFTSSYLINTQNSILSTSIIGDVNIQAFNNGDMYFYTKENLNLTLLRVFDRRSGEEVCSFQGSTNISNEELVGWWTFDEVLPYNSTHNYTPDNSGNGYDGILHDANHSNDDGNSPPYLAESTLGNSLVFDGKDDWVYIQNGENLNFVQNFTILSFVDSKKHLNVSNYNTIISKWNCTISCGLSSWWHGIGNGDGITKYGFTPRFINSSSSSILVNLSNLRQHLNNKGKLFLVNSYNSTNYVSYVNYKQDSNKYFPNQTVLSTDEPVRIGASGHGLLFERNFFNGEILEIRIYNRTLSEKEIKQLYWYSIKNQREGSNQIDLSSCDLNDGSRYKIEMITEDGQRISRTMFNK